MAKLFLIGIQTLALISLYLLASCEQKVDWSKNRLKNSPSPYLAQHKTNPIWWQPWDAQTIAHAQSSEKLIFLSIGYSSCHWCHVMEKEVFEHQDFADVANAHFVSIKVDREARPDLDNYFMKALQTITRQAGWPITLVLTPSLKPVFGATYVPRDKMIYILQELQKAWTQQRSQLIARGQRVIDYVDKPMTADISYLKNQALLHKYFKETKNLFDFRFGGKKGPMKFPINLDLQMLLRYHKQTGNKQALDMAKLTLLQVLKGGIYDHINGGFHRYSTDSQWKIPHFEKMLYDQASFLLILQEIQKLAPHPLFAKAIKETVHFLLTDFRTKDQKGFLSAIDADSEGKEGTFYTWEPGEIKKLLPPQEFQNFLKTYRLERPKKELEGRHVFTLKNTEISATLRPTLDKLKKYQGQREHPFRDEKMITAWNALALSALAKAYRSQPTEVLKTTVYKTVRFILRRLRSSRGQIFRYALNGKPVGDGILDDYAYLTRALIDIYKMNFDEIFLIEAYRLQLVTNKLFQDNKSGNYFFSSQPKESFLRPLKVYHDSVIPSAQSVVWHNLMDLSQYFLNAQFTEDAQRLMNSLPDSFDKFPQSFPSLAMSLNSFIYGSKELFIAGTRKECLAANFEISKDFYPDLNIGCHEQRRSSIPAVRKKIMQNDKVTYYVCTKGLCRPPTHSIEDAKRGLLSKQPIVGK